MSSPRPVTLLPKACEVCSSDGHLLRCTGCRTTFYCGRDHQGQDRENHKRACNMVKKARAHLDSEEQKLREMPGVILTPEKVFENEVGYFWGILETRPYMRARYQFVDALLQLFAVAGGQAEAVQVSLDHLLDMLRLCRSDNMGVRSVIPALYIRLGRDQDAYDFMKFWATTGEEPDYDWGNMDLPFLDVKNADVLESPEGMWTGKFSGLKHANAVLLIKLRVLLDLQHIQNAPQPRGVNVSHEAHQFVGTVVKSRPDLLRSNPQEISSLIEKMKEQAKQIYTAIDQYNPHFWPLMFDDPAAAADNRPMTYYAVKSKDEAHLVISYNYAAWAETKGAFELIKSIKPAP